jgi:hypothetical protein
MPDGEAVASMISWLDKSSISASENKTSLFAIKTMGVIELNTRLTNTLIIKLRPARVSPAAYAALIYALHDNRLSRVVLAYFDEVTQDWSHQFFSDLHSTIAWITTIAKRTAGGDQPVITRLRSLVTLPANQLFRRAFESWKAAGGFFDKNHLNYWLPPSVHNFIILRSKFPSGPIVISGIGDGLPTPIQTTLDLFIERPILELPDLIYARSCDIAYKNSINTLDPMLEDVDAYVYWPTIGLNRRKYQRLLLPWRRKRNWEVMLISITSCDTSINLR